MQGKYNDKIRMNEHSLEKYKKIFRTVGYIKLLLLSVLIYFLYLLISKGFTILSGGICFGCAIFFILFWIYHGVIQEKILYHKGIIQINKRQVDRVTGNWIDFPDTGEEFVNSDHAYARDLDIMGPKSIFQFLNVTNTWHGRQAFANDLLYPHYSNNEIKLRQQAILELSNQTDFSDRIQYYCSKIGADQSTPKLIKELKDTKHFIQNKVLKFILTYIPKLTIILFTSAFLFHEKNLYLAGSVFILLQIIIWSFGAVKTQNYLRVMGHLPYRLRSYSTVIEMLRNCQFTSEKLCQIQSELSLSDLSASKAIKDLSKISDKITARNDAIKYFPLNALFLWDYQCAIMLDDWKCKYASQSESWFLALGEFESLLSFSNLKNVCSNTCLPEAVASAKTIEAKELGHPLLKNQDRVDNDLLFHDNMFIISGSNMSGKTTFLRTVGINMVLAQAGSFVCADKMTFSPMKIITSMRIADDLNEGISTFYAELKKIKAIIDSAKENPDLLFLIDEIFRGTNSADRLSGAKTVLSKLNELDTAGIITTHDMELCNLAEQFPRIKNYNFSEYYDNNKICFDYKIRTGKSTTTNAEYLMKMVGIINERDAL